MFKNPAGTAKDVVGKDLRCVGDESYVRKTFGQPLDASDGIGKAVETDFGRLAAEKAGQALGKQIVSAADYFDFVRVRLSGRLNLISAVNQQKGLVGRDDQGSRRAAEPGQRLQRIFVVKQILPDEHIGTGNDIGVQFAFFYGCLQFFERHAFFSMSAARQLSISYIFTRESPCSSCALMTQFS